MTTEQHRLDKYFGKLWRSRDFRTLWISLTITHFGGQVTFLALPLTAALLLNASPFEMGILTAVCGTWPRFGYTTTLFAGLYVVQESASLSVSGTVEYKHVWP